MPRSRFFEKNRVVQERWFRMKFYSKYGKLIKSILLWKLHRKLEKEFYKNETFINKAIESTVKQCRKIDESLFPATKKLFNIGLYFMLAERDIQAVKADAFAHHNETKRNIALRTLLLTIYEWDIGKVAGRRMNFIYESTGMSDSSKAELVTALKELKNSRKEIESKLSEVRHNTIAHRDADAIRQYELIYGLKIMDYKNEITSYYSASNQLLRALVKALSEAGSPKSLLLQAAKSNHGA